MPKMKTNSSAKKRFKLTGSGKIKRNKAYKRHILTKKTTKQKRNLTYSGLVDKTDESNVKFLLRIGKKIVFNLARLKNLHRVASVTNYKICHVQ